MSRSVASDSVTSGDAVCANGDAGAADLQPGAAHVQPVAVTIDTEAGIAGAPLPPAAAGAITPVTDSRTEPSTRSLAGKGLWAVADQGLFAGSNFIVNVLLANWLVESDFGAFTVGFTVFLLLGTIHNGLLVEPMLVFGPGKYASRRAAYLGTMLMGQAVIGTVAGVVLLVVAGLAWWMAPRELAITLGWCALTGPVVLLLWLMRRACYVGLRPQQAAVAGAGYLVLILVILYALYTMQKVSIGSAMLAMTIAALSAGLWLIHRLKPSLRDARPLVGEVSRDHLRYGRWAAATGVVGFVPGYAYYLMLPLFTDLTDSGALRGLSNFAMPVTQAVWAMCVLLLPRFTMVRGTPAFARTIRLGMIALGVVPAVYWVVVGLLHEPLVQLLYRGKFVEHSHLLWLIALQPALLGVLGVLMAAIQAMQRPALVFWASMWTAVLSIGLGAGMMWQFGLGGAAAATAISFAFNCVVLWVLGRSTLTEAMGSGKLKSSVRVGGGVP